MEDQLLEYNNSPGVVRMDLVLFRDAIEHICRVVRVISQPRGNVLLVGIGKARPVCLGFGRSFAQAGNFQAEVDDSHYPESQFTSANTDCFK